MSLEESIYFTSLQLKQQSRSKQRSKLQSNGLNGLKSLVLDETLDSITGDSTNTNIGSDGGTFTLLERMLGRKLMWLVCYLDTNELPLRHLI